MPNARTITRWLVDHLAEELGIPADSIGLHEPLGSLGLGSSQAVVLSGDLAEWLGRALPPTLAYDFPTIAALAAHLADHDDLAGAPSPGAADAAADAPVEAIAIVGMACRFPGGANDAEAFWRLIDQGGDAITRIPAARWDIDALYDPDPDAVGKVSTRWGGFLSDIDQFDPAFFGISPREASKMDPQQRLALETSWEAIEHARLSPDSLMGTDTSVFLGLIYQEYAGLAGADASSLDGYVATGTAGSVASGRISYALGLKGPSITVDTACSSSLVAIHLACQSLRQGESSLALAGGVTVMLTPTIFLEFSRLRGLAPDGRCKSFSSAADGVAWGEGCGMLVLKRLSDALRDGDQIRAVIRGSAVNQDGRSAGLTAPNGPSQQAVVRRALAQAGVAPATVSYVECHGTGTALGDPLEVAALGAVLAEGRSPQHPVVIGSVKTNIGHAQAAAGVAGILKVVLALEHEQIPRSIHFDAPSPHIPWDALPVQVARESLPWRADGEPRRAGVSSFGLSGTNAHVVIEEAPAHQPRPRAVTPGHQLHVVSARTEAAVRAQAAALAAHLEAHPAASLGDVAFSLATTRSAMEHRLTIAARSREDLVAALTSAARGDTPPGAALGLAAAAGDRVAFLFTGQGAQTLGMGRGLYDAWPAFRAAFDRCTALFDRALERPLREVMWAPSGSPEAALLDQTGYTQPALFTVEYALSELWRSWGVTPAWVAGHSIGELTAACVAGVFSLEDAVRLVAARGQLMQALPAGGAMVSIAAPESEVVEALAAHGGEVAIAAINGARQVVIAGPGPRVELVAQAFAARGVKTRSLAVSHAFHSAAMDPMLDAFARVADTVVYRAPRTPLVSALSGALVGALSGALVGALVNGEVASAGYWVRHVREPVRFADAVRALHAAGARTFVEIGPRAALLGLVPDCVPDGHPVLVASVKAGRDEAQGALEALGAVWAAGGDVAWAGVFGDGAARVDLPTYPWQRRRYWFESRARGSSSDDPIADWFYRLDWPEQPRVAAPAPSRADGAWLVLGDHTGTGAAVSAALAARGATCAVVTRGGGASVRDQVSAALASRADWRGVVYLWGLDVCGDDAASADEAEALALDATAPLLGVCQALDAAGAGALLWVVTRGACPVPDDAAVRPWQAAMWGLGRVAAQELAARWGGIVDLDPRGPAQDVDALIAELLAPDAEDQLALRGGRRHAARLVPATAPARADRGPLRDDATYWVTGGLGALGLRVAHWLVERGARHLLLTSRRGLDTPGARDAVAALEAQGVAVVVAAVDAADDAGTRAALAQLAHPVRGVVHAAGVGPVQALADTDDALLAEVLRPKVAGSWVVHRALADQPVEFFVLFASGAGIWGGAGQAAYAAANAFLDGLAHLRRARGLPALSVDWGVWSEGMSEQDPSFQARLGKLGVLAMAPGLALAALDRLLDAGGAQRTVARIDWARFAPIYAARGRRNLLAALVRDDAPPSDAAGADHASTRRWKGQSAAELRPWLTDLVRAAVAGVLGFAHPGEVDPARGFAEQGIDSLMAVQIRDRLSRELGVRLASTIAFDHPSVERLVAHLLVDVLAVEGRAAAAPQLAGGSDDPIAVIGAGCRFPGGADDLAAYWRLLAGGEVASAEVPRSRWHASDWFHPVPETPGRTYVTKGGFLRDLESFDPAFFRISPREASRIDPQQRLLLEVSWEALERAGQDPAALRDTRTGVFVGVGDNEYVERLKGRADLAADAYAATGNAVSFIAGRLSFALGLRGPSLAIDTACSSSLVALHLACQSLRAGECELALAGGVNALLSPESFVALSQIRALSPDGRCKTFSAEADGYARAEGCGVVVLKRLSAALRDGDPIQCVIRGTAVNHDGPSSGLTVPNGPAQQALLRDALARAAVAPADVDFVECHGTGTSLGDPIEVNALAEVFGAGRAADRPLVLGAAKANLGHLESASGMAGVLKVMLALEHQLIPAQPAFDALNPHVAWAELPVVVAREPQPWTRGDRPRRAGVSSFGLSGTNAHIVIEDAPAAPATAAAALVDRPAELVVVSARSAAALNAQADRLARHLDAHPEASLGAVAASLATGRCAMEHRFAVAVSTRDELRAALERAARGEAPAAEATAAPGALAFLFTGQGAQVVGMGRALYASWPVFRDALDRCAALFDRELARPLLEVMWAPPGSPDAALLDQTGYTQPALFAVELAQCALWRSWGVEPALVAGHSIGELVAACVAGVFSLEDAVRLVAARGRLMQALPAGGAMVSIAAAEAEVAEAAQRHAGEVSIAAVNGAAQVVVSGRAEAVEAVAAGFAQRGVRTRRLVVSHAFHSALMDPMLEAFARVAETVAYRRPDRVLVSNLTGAVVSDEVTAPDYWVRHVRETVRFSAGVAALHQAGARTYVEIGPRAALLGLVPGCLPDADVALVPFAKAGADEVVTALAALGAVWAGGGAVDWRGVFPARRVVALPTYCWQRERHWVDANYQPAGGPADPIADWYYELDWPAQPRAADAAPSAGAGSWLILRDRGGVGDALCAELAAYGRSCATVDRGSGELTRDRLRELLAGRDDWQGVVYLWGLDADADEGSSARDVGAQVIAATAPVLALIDAVGGAARSARLWLVTRGACAVEHDGVIRPWQAALWGMGRVAAQELPAAWGGLVDLDPRGGDGDVRALVAELLAPGLDDQLAYRDGRRLAARLVPARRAASATPTPVSPDASYLITGGLGALGVHVARWLVGRGARELVLTSRRGLETAQAQAIVTELEASGARVIVAAVDVADLEGMRGALGALHRPLRGVIHAAGVLGDGLLAHLDAARLAEVLRPKVDGAWVLHQLTIGRPLDFFVMFSSIASVSGAMGQGSYAAANAFLDGLAARRRVAGLPAASLAWGLWEDGMGSAAQRDDHAASGMVAMPVALALSALDRLDGGATRVVARIRWDQWAAGASRPDRGRLYDLLIGGGERAAPAAPARQWKGQSADEVRPWLRALVRATVASVLGFADPGSVDPVRGFAEQGLDSLLAVQIRNRLQKELGVTLAATLAFDHPSVDKLVGHLLTDVLALEVQAGRSTERQVALHEPIALIGAACRFPGGADDLDRFWDLLSRSGIAATEVPADRWNHADYYDPNPEALGRTCARRAGYLGDVAGFDPTFFRISPREAMSLDPQQRLLLEVSWEALESAGVDPATLRESPTGVFVGMAPNEYAERIQLGVNDDVYNATGNGTSFTAGRLSFVLGLRGPSLAVDTACSSSLVALHLACQSLRLGECDAALAGGVNVLVSPRLFVAMSRVRALSADGQCKTFSADADGYGRGEGCGVLVLKRLSDARRDGDQVLAVIRGTAINHDGPSSGLTVPSGPAQQAVIRQALAQAQIAPGAVDFVECHGTGTSLGDPIEVQALSAAYGADRAADRKLILGAVKANLGHLEPAAGVAGVLKAVLALRHGQIPAQPPIGELNPHLAWATLPVEVAREPVAWPRGERPRYAGVSSFGISGTNAHVVLEEAPMWEEPERAAARSAELLVVSAKSEGAVTAQAERLARQLEAAGGEALGDVARSLATTRSAMEERVVVVAETREEAAAALAAVARGELPGGVVRGRATETTGKIVFVFPGQGSQWLGMGRRLLEEEPAFAEAVAACDRAIQAEAGFSVLAELRAEEAESQLERIDVVQPVLFAMSVGLAAVWRSWGIEPDAVVGHSMGEVAAAYVAGALSLGDAAAVICRRSKLLRRISGQGAMAMVELTVAEAEAELVGYEDRLSVAV
ncbi:MAG TPA: SDR family NAD(P)-dependent oxidoreductase, partial [Kofleriaceae bacterium]|nr:SDR family NAD(P)-dependent oxidoreductase [Kofleriaceae bacterium]